MQAPEGRREIGGPAVLLKPHMRVRPIAPLDATQQASSQVSMILEKALRWRTRVIGG